MTHKSYIYLLLWIPLVYACQLDPLPQDELPSFNKLYAVSENVEAVDFICKPDQSGYIILGNIKTNENSDLFLIDVGSDGIQRELYRINTNFYDEAVKLGIDETDNSLIVLGHRRRESTEANVFQNFLLKTDMDGIPVKAQNASEEDSVSAEIKIITNNQSSPDQLNDFIIIPPHLITVGTRRQLSTGNSNEITRIYDWTSFNFADTSDLDIVQTSQKPVANQIPFNNSRNLKVLEGNIGDAVYEVFGQNRQINPTVEDSIPSANITWAVYTDVQSNAEEPVYIGNDKNEALGNILRHSNGKTYIGGSYMDPAEENPLFLITKEYEGEDNNQSQNVYAFSDYGTKVSSLAEDVDQNIILATIDEGTLNNISYLLKFSPAGVPIENQDFEFGTTGFHNIKKIECEPNNVVVILSQKTFENNSTAIGLMKMKF